MIKAGQIVWNQRVGASLNARRKLPAMMHDYFTQVRELLATNPAPAELHAVRLATKRVRYTLELLRGGWPALPKARRRGVSRTGS